MPGVPFASVFRMRLKYKILVLAVLPLLAALLAIAAIVLVEAQSLAQRQVALLEESMLAAKRAELKHYVGLALSSIEHLYAAGRDDPEAREQAKRILGEMNYGDDGYFFVYDLAGNNLVHPRLRELVGKDLSAVRDSSGLPVIQKLLEVARSGGGFQHYRWHKPSSGKETDKLGYVVELQRWGWMLGTGIYLDDVAASTGKLREELSLHIRETMLWLALLAVIATVGVFAGGLALNISEHRLADRRLKALAQRIVSLQEEERARVSRELHDGLGQLLVSTKFHVESGLQRCIEGRHDAVTVLGKGLSGIADAISEVRRISHDLRPLALDHLGLPAALQQLADDFALRTGIATVTHIEPLVPTHDDVAMTSLFRIAQEALSNIERHAAARHVALRLSCGPAGVHLLVSDDGCGFNPQSADQSSVGGIGLRNMRERIEHHGGRLQIRSVPGCTELQAALPVCTHQAGAGA